MTNPNTLPSAGNADGAVVKFEGPKHTPGPWKRSGGGGVVACMESETLSSGRRVARRVACAKGISIAEVEANADLIAALPDILAAAKRLAPVADYIGVEAFDDEKVNLVTTIGALRQLQSALAKAEPTA